MAMKPYRKPTVCVVGAGAAGVAAAAECALIGFDTVLVDEKDKVGGKYVGPRPADRPKKFGFRKGNLKHSKYKGSAASACAHIKAALDYSPARLRLQTRADSAAFDKETAQWHIGVSDANTGESANELIKADVLILATGTSSLDEIRGPHGREIDVAGLHRHLDIVPIGAPNMLLMDAPEPAVEGFFSHPLDLIEAKANHAQHWVRRLEVKGPGQLAVNRSYWKTAAPERKKLISQLRDFMESAHTHTPLTES